MEARRRPWWVDDQAPLDWREREARNWYPRQIVVAIAVAAIELGGTFAAAHRQTDREALDALAVALIVAGAAALPLRRRFPVGVLVFVHAATTTYWTLGYPGGPVFLALIIAFFRVMIVGRRAAAWTVLALGFLAANWLPWLVGDEPAPSLAATLGLGAWLLVLGFVAELVRNGRESAARAVRERREHERRRVSEERLRIARELHDVLAHNISMINVQAGVALHLLDERPEQARPALSAIKQASKEALTELRSVLGVLRQPDEDEDGSRAPAPSLVRLGDLVERSAAAGLTVRTQTEGPARPLPAPVDLAAFRIVQEALTNVVRHARAKSATVRVAYAEDAVTVQVDDDGRGGGADGSDGGSGIVGMRERAESVGGSFEAGPGPGGGFRVRARLPIDEAAS